MRGIEHQRRTAGRLLRTRHDVDGRIIDRRDVERDAGAGGLAAARAGVAIVVDADAQRDLAGDVGAGQVAPAGGDEGVQVGLRAGQVSAPALPPTVTPLPLMADSVPDGTDRVTVSRPLPASTSLTVMPVMTPAVSSVRLMLDGAVMTARR